MKTRIILAATLALGLLGALALAADASGKWIAQVPGREGQTRETTFNLKVEGDKLTGTVSGRQGDIPITDGKVAGDSISFKMAQGQNTFTYKGKLAGDEIKFTREREGGGGQAQEFTAKRAK